MKKLFANSSDWFIHTIAHFINFIFIFYLILKFAIMGVQIFFKKLTKTISVATRNKPRIIVYVSILLALAFLSVPIATIHINNPENFMETGMAATSVPINSPNQSCSGNWTQFQGNSYHNGLSNCYGPTNNSIIWQYNLGGSEDTILEYNHQLIITEPNQEYGYYYSFSPSFGTKVWTGSTALTSSSDPTSVGSFYPAISSGKIMLQNFCIGCFFSEGPWLTLDNAQNGSFINVSSINAAPACNKNYGYGLIAASNNYFYFACDGGSNLSLYKNNLSTLTYTNLPWAIDTIPTIENNSVILGFSNSSYIDVLNGSSLNLEWNLKLNSPLISSPSYYHNVIYLNTINGTIYAISNKGSIIWQDNFAGTNFLNTPAICNSYLFTTSGNYLYSIDRNNGTVNWKKAFNENLTVSPIISKNHLVYFGGSGGTIFAVEATDGNVLWSYDTNYSIYTEPILYNKFLYVANSNGTIFAIGNAYRVSFSRYSLKDGSYWWVNFENGKNYSTNKLYMNIFLPNGTYQYIFGTNRTRMISETFINYLNISGVKENRSLIFKEGYQVTFTENGLPSAYNWEVNLSNGMGKSVSAGTNISFCLPNGTLSYTISSNNNYYTSNPSGGTITVNAKNVTDSVQFGHTIEVIIVITVIFAVFILGSILSLLFGSDYFDIAFAIAGALAGASLYVLHSSTVFTSPIYVVIMLAIILVISIILVRYVYALSVPLNILLLLVLYHISTGTSITLGNTLGWMILVQVLGNYSILMIFPYIAIIIKTLYTYSIDDLEIEEGLFAMAMHILTESNLLIFSIWFLIISSVWPTSDFEYLFPLYVVNILVLIPLHKKFSKGFDVHFIGD